MRLKQLENKIIENRTIPNIPNIIAYCNAHNRQCTHSCMATEYRKIYTRENILYILEYLFTMISTVSFKIILKLKKN